MKLVKPMLAATVAAFMLSGCYNQPGLVEDQSFDRTKTGAATGALAGALVGYNTKGHHSGQRALIGGLLGAAVGGAVGYSMDNQANEIFLLFRFGRNSCRCAQIHCRIPG